MRIFISPFRFICKRRTRFRSKTGCPLRTGEAQSLSPSGKDFTGTSASTTAQKGQKKKITKHRKAVSTVENSVGSVSTSAGNLQRSRRPGGPNTCALD